MDGDVDRLIEYSKRLNDAERDVEDRLSDRGRLVVARCVGILGILGIALYFSPTRSLDVLYNDGVPVSTALAKLALSLIAIGLLHNLCSAIVYLNHHEDESRNIYNRTSLSEMASRWFRIQPSTDHVRESYLFETLVRDVSTKQLASSLGLCSSRPVVWLAPLAIRWRICFVAISKQCVARYIEKALITGEAADSSENRRKYRKQCSTATAGRPRRLRVPLKLKIGVISTVVFLWYLIPGTHILRFCRDLVRSGFRHANRKILRDIVAEYYLQTYGRYKADGQFIVLGRDFRGGQELEWTREQLITQVVMNPHHMVVSRTYYGQLSEGFCIRVIGRADVVKTHSVLLPHEDGQKLEFFVEREELVPGERSLLDMTDVQWRIIVSEYVSAQQLRTRNWNLHYRVKQAERLLKIGAICIVVGAVVLSIVIFDINRQEANLQYNDLGENGNGAMP